MRITPLDIAGAALIEMTPIQDERGLFARAFCREEFIAAGLDPLIEQCNVSYNQLAGTLRGMHWQAEPAPEAKLVRCTRGAISDVLVDMRQGSATYLRHHAVELTEQNRLALYVPPLFAHGYLTLVDGSEVSYQVSAAYSPAAERGLRYDDPLLAIQWAGPVVSISEKDRSWPLMQDGTQ